MWVKYDLMGKFLIFYFFTIIGPLYLQTRVFDTFLNKGKGGSAKLDNKVP